jgi:hypothetical protein
VLNADSEGSIIEIKDIGHGVEIHKISDKLQIVVPDALEHDTDPLPCDI